MPKYRKFPGIPYQLQRIGFSNIYWTTSSSATKTRKFMKEISHFCVRRYEPTGDCATSPTGRECRSAYPGHRN
ncbi:unnamed protein product [Bathycoccus prasinos]